jgi:hypothetical protein
MLSYDTAQHENCVSWKYPFKFKFKFNSGRDSQRDNICLALRQVQKWSCSESASRHQVSNPIILMKKW